MDATIVDDVFWDVIPTAEGRIVAIGYGGSSMATVRTTSSGELDVTFDGDGIAHPPTGCCGSTGYEVVQQADGRYVIIGRSTTKFGAGRFRLGDEVEDYAGSWAAADLFGACLHTLTPDAVPSAWALAGSGNCTTTNDANWNALPTAAVAIASAPAPTTTATATIRYGFKAASNQPPGGYEAPITFEVLAPSP